MRYINKTILFLLLITANASPSQTNREDEPYCDERSTPKVEITDSDATILGLTIGRASLKDVQAKLGSTEERDLSVCYVSPIDGTVLVFYSGVMASGWKNITRFDLWSREAAFPHTSQCTSSNSVSRSLRTQSGIRLGLTKADLEQILGKPTKRGSKSDRYNFLCRRKMTEDEIKGFKTANNWDVRSDPYFDRMSWVEVRYMDSTTSRIEISEIESY